MRWPFFILLLAAFTAAPLSAWADKPSEATRGEISHLLDYIGSSGCQYYRNGSWYDAQQARNHLEMKYNYLLKKKQIGTAEDFITRAATASSISGEAYQIQCPGQAPVPSAAWLLAELLRMRQADHSPR